MRKPIQTIAQAIYKQFKLFWVIISTIMLILCLYINWHVSINTSYRKIDDVAINLSNNVDGLIEDLFQDIYTLPIYGKNITDCKTGLFINLQRITLNNPKISGIVISDDKHQIICSTLPNNSAFISGSIQARTLIGPIKLSMFDQPVYLLQQKMGNYHIGIIIVSSVLQNILQSPNAITELIALHSEFEKKNILSIERTNKKQGWMFSKNIESQSPIHSDSLFAIEKLQSIDGVVVVVFESHKTVLSNLWYSQILMSIVVLIGSYLIYCLLKNLIAKRYSLHGAMKLGIKNKEFYPVYQPLFDNHRCGFSGVEVLLRWQDYQDEIIMPDFFISEAETTGLIVPITLQIMEIAFQEFKSILSADPQFHLAFNLSALHFTDASFFNEFYRLAQYYTIVPKQVLFEITERDLLDKNDAIFIDKMQELRKSGYSLAVDDYGTGHASISYLQHYPFNYLKIDKLFVQAIGTKAITESLNDAIIEMAKRLNLIIIAEGVETIEQVNYLTQHGVQYLQGWYFSKALSIEQLNCFLKEHHHETL